MDSPEQRLVLLMWLLKGTWLLFVFAFGACVGSLVNVLVYRLPLGQSVVTPPSRCPKCDTRLTWRENIPILGWLLLRGRCRFCRSPISPEYPLVEAFTGVLFATFFALWYVVPPGASWLGVDWSSIRPEWALNPADQTWPMFLVILVLLGSLIAMTLVDARTFTIPLVLAWVPAIVGLVGHTAAAIWVQSTSRGLIWTAPGAIWAIPTPTSVSAGTPGWEWIGAAIGGVAGMAVGNLLLGIGLLTRSFADYEEWERKCRGQGDPESAAPAAPAVDPGRPADGAEAQQPRHRVPIGARVLLDTVFLMFAGGVLAATLGRPAWMGILPAIVLGPVLTGLWIGGTRRPAALPDAGSHDPAETWIQYPHARREMVRELAFLAPCAVLAMAGWHFAAWAAPAGQMPPLWLSVVSGVLLGYLVGGGVVWAVRIFGSVAFGKEAMGLGDVHLMAGVGACLGWIDATLAFFGAAFVGLYFAILGRVHSGVLRQAMPYGPYLAVATVLVLLGKPLFEMGLSRLVGSPVNIP